MLCVRYFVEHFMHYDHNNKAKFYMMPILLSLGVDVAWLDLDIFLFKDPTPRLVELAYPRSDLSIYLSLSLSLSPYIYIYIYRCLCS